MSITPTHDDINAENHGPSSTPKANGVNGAFSTTPSLKDVTSTPTVKRDHSQSGKRDAFLSCICAGLVTVLSALSLAPSTASAQALFPLTCQEVQLGNMDDSHIIRKQANAGPLQQEVAVLFYKDDPILSFTTTPRQTVMRPNMNECVLLLGNPTEAGRSVTYCYAGQGGDSVGQLNFTSAKQNSADMENCP